MIAPTFPFIAVCEDGTEILIEAEHILAAICEAERQARKPIASVRYTGQGTPPPLPVLYTHPRTV